MTDQASTNSAASTISETEFIKLCDDVYADRHQIYQFNPGAGKREALLWMLFGCLMSLLSASLAEQSSEDTGSTSDPYTDAINEVLRNRMNPPFDPQTHLAELSKKIDEEEESK